MAGIPTFSPDPALYPDPTGRADRICRFIRLLRLWEGRFAGERFTLHPFQEAMLRRIFGPVTEAGTPLVRMACIWIPRGAAKTTLASAISLAFLLGPENEAGGQIIQAAADQENAGIAFNSAWQMVQQDPALLKRVRSIESRKRLYHKKSASVMKAISSEAYSKHGLNASLFLADEIHSWNPTEGRKLFKTVQDSMVKRDRPLTITISTAGEGEGGLAWDLWSYSLAVARGEVTDPTFAPIIFAAQPDADWRDEAAWFAANPAMDAGFCSVEELRAKARRVQHFPAEIADFRRFHLNQWQAAAANPWLDLAIYDTNPPAADPDDLTGRPCVVAVDLSSVEDLTAVVAVFPSDDGEDRSYDVLATFFLPEVGLAKKADRDRADYLRWAEAGHLVVTEGNRVDYDAVLACIRDYAERFAVRTVAFDKWNSNAVTTTLQKDGLPVTEYRQGMVSMAAPVRELKRAILGGQFRCSNPIMRSCFGHVRTEKDASENEKFTKATSRGRIDGAVASAMAVGCILNGDAAVSVYDTPARADGFLFV